MASSGRDDRLKWTKKAETRLREELRYIALKKCDPVVSKFAACAEEQGLMVVFKCREQSKKMNDCLMSYTDKESFEQYKEARERELLRKGTEEREIATT